jgi:hypothetical protein
VVGQEVTSDRSRVCCDAPFSPVMSIQHIYTTADHLPNPRLGLTYIPVRECQLLTYKENPENKALVGVLLRVLHYTGSGGGDDNRLRYNGQNVYQARANTRFKTVGDRKYDRMFTFADVLHPGACFVIICNTHQDSTRLLQRCTKTQEGVGDMFAIIEPDMVEAYLGENTSVPIVEFPMDFYPVNNKFVDSVPTSKLITPEMDHTAYFCMHKEKIQCRRATLEMSTCAGSFCDRQRSDLGTNQKCGCSYVKSKGNLDLVISVDVTFTVDKQFNVNGRTTVPRFRSWRYSNLFVTDVTVWPKLHPDDDLSALRQAVNDITKHVNDNGGWTIIGWICTGRVKDGSSDVNTSDQIEPLFPTIHITYLFPSETAIATTDAIKVLQLKKT